MSRRPLIFFLLMVLLDGGVARGDDRCLGDQGLVSTGIGTWSEELTRLAELAPGTLAPGSGILRRGGVTTRALCSDAPAVVWGARFVAPLDGRGVAVVPPKLSLAYQSLAPGGGNDGLLWQGRGFSSLLSGGIRGGWGAFSFQLAPEVTWSQNQDFRMVDTGGTGNERFRYPWYVGDLDVPQRFGDRPFARIAFGQSYAAVEKFGARLALSTENLWWGPGIRNALLLTNNAAGFPHVSLSTSRPLDVWIGHLEAELVLGTLARTKYAAVRERRYFNGIALTLEPRWTPGLFLGFGRTFVEDRRTLEENGFFPVLQTASQQKAGDVPADNQIASAWVRWVMPDIELYGEYGLDDYPSLPGLARIPDRAAAWVLGFQKRWVRGDRWWRVEGELAKTRSNLPPGYATSFYTHGRGADYTNDGQLLGAFIGPGADTQYLAVDAFDSSGRIGGYFERVRRNEEVFWSRFADSKTTDHDAEVVLGARQVLFTRRAEIGWDVAAGYRYNRDFLQRFAVTLRGMLTVTVPLDLGPARSDAGPSATEPPAPPAQVTP